MSICYFNGKFLKKERVKVSPDDRGFLFADGVYEVVRWYEGSFFDMESHMARLKRSMKEIRISWPEADSFPSVALKLISKNGLQKRPSLVYLQVTRGAAKRTHAFPSPPVAPTVYANAWGFNPAKDLISAGIETILRQDPRWNRCDIKSVSLLPNVLSFQEATENGSMECIFVRDGMMTECAHSNVFFVIDGKVFTHPESENILSGVTRKNIIRIAREAGISVFEMPVAASRLNEISEAFITNTSYEIAPVVSIGKNTVGDGKPGPVTKLLRENFDSVIGDLKG
ncbi:MAG: aminotransferase class IV [Bacteroidales bacterium]|jgi:D-alanine transaminase|nr:aminotransferase class IV [Bacteroidales bacterium]